MGGQRESSVSSALRLLARRATTRQSRREGVLGWGARALMRRLEEPLWDFVGVLGEGGRMGMSKGGGAARTGGSGLRAGSEGGGGRRTRAYVDVRSVSERRLLSFIPKGAGDQAEVPHRR